MKKTSRGFHVLVIMLAGILLSHAVRSSDVNGTVTFTANTTARASEINANFNAVISAVNDNHARITALESDTNLTKCPPDMVPNGPGCIDRYEASVWETMDTGLIAKIRTGAATKSDLTAAGTQRGVRIASEGGDDYGNGCPDTANGCKTFYAASIADVTPARNITWFQALATCRNAGKRLPTNQEWQMAAFGTPDPGTDSDTAKNCNVASNMVSNTGAQSICVSDVGAYDMVGNLHEWVAEWVQGSNSTWSPLGGTQPSSYGSDAAGGVNPAVNITGSPVMPSASFRGGAYVHGPGAGVFYIDWNWSPAGFHEHIGFRCTK